MVLGFRAGLMLLGGSGFRLESTWRFGVVVLCFSEALSIACILSRLEVSMNIQLIFMWPITYPGTLNNRL